MSIFNYGYKHNEKLAKHDLAYNLSCIQHLGQILKTIKCLDLPQAVYCTTRNKIRSRLNVLHSDRTSLLAKRAEYRRAQYESSKSKENLERREGQFSELIDNLSLSDLEILKEFIYKV